MREFLGRPVPEDDPRFAPGRHRAHPGGPLRVVVVGDSLAFTDHEGPQLPDVAHLWPNVVAAGLGRRVGVPVAVDVLARPALTARDAWELVHKDRHAMFAVLARADAVVAAVGSYDHAPAGVPLVLEQMVPHLRPTGLRRRVRAVLRAAYPVLVRATGGRRARTGRGAFVERYAAVLHQLRSLTFGAAGVVVGPTSHRTTYYGQGHPTHAARSRLQLRLAESDGFATVDPWPLVLPHVDGLNPDGIHWPPAAHESVGTAVADLLAAQLSGEAPRPPRPGFDPGTRGGAGG